tara:strand:+ start:1124 stop:1570 length:447 start_codon:yes stop_codon:yes gene_type:complete
MVHVELTVAAIVARGPRYLVVEEAVNGRHVINQPAGHVEPGETVLEAAIRETREESAWRFVPTGVVGLYYWPHLDGRTTLRVAIAGQVSDHEPARALDSPIVAAHWLMRNELAQDYTMRSPLVLRAIDDYERRSLMPLDYLHHIENTP